MDKELWNKLYPNFKKSEFACRCGCCKEPEMDEKLMNILQAIRNKYGEVNIITGYRCKKYNDSLKGSIPNSDHLYFRAADIQFAGCTDPNKRKEVIDFAKNFVGFKYGYHATAIYKNGNWNNCNYPNMGKSVHISVED